MIHKSISWKSHNRLKSEQHTGPTTKQSSDGGCSVLNSAFSEDFKLYFFNTWLFSFRKEGNLLKRALKSRSQSSPWKRLLKHWMFIDNALLLFTENKWEVWRAKQTNKKETLLYKSNIHGLWNKSALRTNLQRTPIVSQNSKSARTLVASGAWKESIQSQKPLQGFHSDNCLGS